MLDENIFNTYFTETRNDGSYIEIQTRGDVFWVKCTGEKNKTCQMTKDYCYIPGKYKELVCNQCGSPLKVYFEFPGMKEKDYKMSKVIGGLWKYLAYRCSSVIVVGSSMDYDRILLAFLQELVSSREIPILYIAYIPGEEPKPEPNAAINAFFDPNTYEKKPLGIICNKENGADKVLREIYNNYNSSVKSIPVDNWKYSLDVFSNHCCQLISPARKITVVEAFLRREGLDLIDEGEIIKMKSSSQLGLKTFWLTGQMVGHDRYNHSLGVLMIASTLYLAAKGNDALVEELKFLQLAALLHDIGHLPFSHLIEEIFEEFGWVSPGEHVAFSHEHNAKDKISKLLDNKKISEFLHSTGYDDKDLLRLIHGEFGVGYLDAIINSPLDADKMEYLHSDSTYTRSKREGNFTTFIETICKDISVNKNCFLVFKGSSTKMALQLLELRGYMYDEVYFNSGLRYLEACCKLILKVFFAHKCTEEGLISEYKLEENEKIYDLSYIKKRQIIDYIDEESNKNGDPTKPNELHLLKSIKDYLDNLFEDGLLDASIKEAIDFCYKKVAVASYYDQNKNIQTMDVLNEDISTYKIDRDNKDNKVRSVLNKLIKDVHLRFPGVILIDHIISRSMFSFSEAGKKIKRRDESYERVENILIKDIDQSSHTRKEGFRCFSDATEEITKQIYTRNHEYINLYKITDDRYAYMKAEDYVISELRTQRLISDARSDSV